MFSRSCIWTDGRPAPALKGQLRRKQEREVLAVSISTHRIPYFLHTICQPWCPRQRRIVMLNNEVDRGMDMWKETQEEARRIEEHKKSLLLKPKGKLLIKKKA